MGATTDTNSVRQNVCNAVAQYPYRRWYVTKRRRKIALSGNGLIGAYKHSALLFELQRAEVGDTTSACHWMFNRENGSKRRRSIAEVLCTTNACHWMFNRGNVSKRRRSIADLLRTTSASHCVIIRGNVAKIHRSIENLTKNLHSDTSRSHGSLKSASSFANS